MGLITFIISLAKSAIAGVSIGISSFLYSSALRVVDNSKFDSLGHLAGSALMSIGFIISCTFKLPIFVGRLGSIFDNAGVKLFTTSFFGMMVGNIGGAIAVGILVHVLLKQTSLIPIVKNIANELTNLNNLNQYINCALSSVFSGAIIYSAAMIFNGNRLKPRAFIILIFMTLLSFFNKFQYSIGNIFFFAYAGMINKYVGINLAITIIGNIIGTIPMSLMFKVDVKVAGAEA